MRGFFKNSENYISLSPKITTIGREGCDVVIQSSSIDPQHAVVEYVEPDQLYILRDLGSAQGTFVNEVRVHNAAVRLSPGDIIRFGFPGVTYEFGFEQLAHSSNQNNHRAAWTQPLTSQREQPSYSHHSLHGGLPCITGPALSCTLWSNPLQQHTVPVIPQPVVIGRPSSAGPSRRASIERKQPNFCKFNQIGPQIPDVKGPDIPVSTSLGYGSQNFCNGFPAASSINVNNSVRKSENEHLNLLSEKDKTIEELTAEIQRLRFIESESIRKDALQGRYQRDDANKDATIRELQKELHDVSIKLSSRRNDEEMIEKLVSLENELKYRDEEISQLKIQIGVTEENSTLAMKRELSEKVSEVNGLQISVLQLQKDKECVSNLLTELQKNICSKDSTISRLCQEAKDLKSQLQEREMVVAKMSSKISDLEASNNISESQAREKELISLRKEFKMAEDKMCHQDQMIVTLQNDLSLMEKQIEGKNTIETSLRNELNVLNGQLADSNGLLNTLNQDLLNTSNRLFNFRHQVMKACQIEDGLSTDELSDLDLVHCLGKTSESARKDKETIIKLENEAKEYQIKNEQLSQKSSASYSEVLSIITNVHQVGDISQLIKSELDSCAAAGSENLSISLHDSFLKIIVKVLDWESCMMRSMDQFACISNKDQGILKCIKDMTENFNNVKEENQRLREEKDDITKCYETQLQTVQDEFSMQKNHLVKQHEKLLEEKNEVHASEFKNFELQEKSKHQDILVDLENKMKDRDEQIQILNQTLAAKEDDIRCKSAEIADISEKQTMMETTNKTTLENLHAKFLVEKEILTSEWQIKEENLREEMELNLKEIQEKRERISSLETKIEEATTKKSEANNKVSQLKRNLRELKEQYELSPGMKSHTEIAAIEQTNAILRDENRDLKQQLCHHQDINVKLKHDLQIALAQASDISGELSEKQKIEIETNQDLLVKYQSELTESQQQLAKLSEIVDEQKEEVYNLNESLKKEKKGFDEIKVVADDRQQKILELQEMLRLEKLESTKQIELIDKENKVSIELTAVGARCRGERHESIISKQREALAEMRSRVKALESKTLPLNKPEALQQVLTLKKEFADLQETHEASRNVKGDTVLDSHVGKIRGLGRTYDPELDIEKSAHKDCQEALEFSESSYLALLRSVTSTLNIAEVIGAWSMANVSREDRRKLLTEREQMNNDITLKIRAISDRVSRKDDLLQDYETDLSKMRRAQDIAQQKSIDVENLTDDVRRGIEETQYLRESLRHVKEDLEKEKRLNYAIKQKKTFHLENEKAHLARPPKVHRCQTADDVKKDSYRLKQQKDQLKKKEYEVKSLKQQLYDREKDIIEKERQLVELESSLGVK